MADVNLSVYATTKSGLDLTTNKTTVNTSNTYKFLNDGRTKVFVNNTTNANCTVTIVTPQTEDGLAITDRTVAVPTLKAYSLGPYAADPYNDDNGYVALTFDQAVEITAFRG